MARRSKISQEIEKEPVIKEEPVKKADKEGCNPVLLEIEKGFTDKITGEIYKVGDIIEVSKKRAEELLKDIRKLIKKKK